MLDPSHRPGYDEIATVRLLGSDDPAWLVLTEKTLGLPVWMVPAVIRAVNYGAWRRANDPTASLRDHAKRVAGRMRLRGPKEPKEKS